MSALFLYILQCCKRDKILLSLLTCIVGGFLLCIFLGSVATYEQNQMKIVFSASAFRLILVYGFAIFNVFFISRMVQSREIETFVAGPVKRSTIVFALMLANLLLIACVCVFSAFLLKSLFWSIIPNANILFWCVSLMLEVMIVTSISIFFAIMLANPTVCILLVTVIYITSRIMGFILTSIEVAFQGFSFMGIVKTLIIPLSVFFPRLDLFTQSEWLIYSGNISNAWFIILQGLIYVAIVICACVVDFNKKPL